MADDTRKPAETKSATPAASPTATASAKPAAAKPAARARKTTAAAPATRRSAPATARSTTAAAKKTATRAPVSRKSPPVKKAAHEPEPFVAKGKAGKPPKAKKAKLIRDSFTMPDGEYAQIAAIKKRCLDAGVSAKKSEILRAAVANLAKLSDASVVAAVRRLEVIKTGRPAKGSK